MRHQCKELDALSRRTGIPKYQHHVTVHSNGRMFFPVRVLKLFNLSENDAFSKVEFGKDSCTITIEDDPERLLKHHLRSARCRTSPSILVWRKVSGWLQANGYALPRRMRFLGPPQPDADGTRKLTMDYRAVRDLHAIAEENHWFDGA